MKHRRGRGSRVPRGFDVFFSYSTVDHAAVERVARALHERGIRVFLNRWYLAAGSGADAGRVRCGRRLRRRRRPRPWQQRERDLALDRQGREPDFPVIPVLLSTADLPWDFSDSTPGSICRRVPPTTLRSSSWWWPFAGSRHHAAVERVARSLYERGIGA